MEIINWSLLSKNEQLCALKRSPLTSDINLETQVKTIVEKVVNNGDSALKAFNIKFDKTITDNLKLSKERISSACDNLSSDLKQAILSAIDNISVFHQSQIFNPIDIETQNGVRCELRSEPIEKIGLYIPGGTAPLISTVLMLAIPAAIAKCEKKVLVSPPPINDAMIFAANTCGIDEIYQVGGAQAIAALAFGTESIPAVDKIYGPGNRYVTEAKRLVTQDNRISVSIDMPAGPSEVLVIADKYANPKFVAVDLLSQAEHGDDSQAMLVTDSQTLADQVVTEISSQLAALPRKPIAEKALETSRIIVVGDINAAVQVSNLYAPEHLIIQTQNPRETLINVRAAGSVFLGQFTPESVGDYASGTNHVLPTYGYSKSVSSLSVADFCRRFTVQELTEQGLSNIGPSVMELAAAEKLDAHKNAVAIRLNSISSSGSD